MQTPYLSFEDYQQIMANSPLPAPQKALVMYHHAWGAMVTDPRCMTVPVDDHLVHRGDGVFETLLFEGGAVYNLEAHLKRLEASSAAIGLEVPLAKGALTSVIRDCFELAGLDRALGRILVGRGQGGFSVDPAECEKASLYMIVYQAPPPFMVRYPEGAKAILSQTPPKAGKLSTIKTCNYIPNALMKAEANAAGVHFALGVDGDGYLTESATENLAGIREDGAFLIPPCVQHLPGTTLKRVSELAQSSGREVLEIKLKPEDLFALSEVLIVGTTAYVTRVVELDGRPLPTGPLAGQLAELLLKDIYQNA